MASEPLTMGTERANIFQKTIQDELSRRGYDADQVMAEYIAIMVINNKTADQINAELSDLIGPEYDPDFSRWLFEAAKPPPSAPAPTPASTSASSVPPAPRLVSQAITAATGSKRSSDAVESPTGTVPPQRRRLDAPAAPRAMRDEKSDGPSSDRRSLLDRMGGQPQRIHSFDGDRDRFAHRNERFGGVPRHQNQQQQQPGFNGPPPGMMDPAMMNMDPAAMMMMMGMGMPQMNMGVAPGLQDLLGSNLAMMQQMQEMMQQMQQNQQQQVVAPTPLKATAEPFVPAVAKPEPPARPETPSLCKFGSNCTNVTCRYSHPSPVASQTSGVVLSTEVCENGPGGRDCEDPDCVKSHVSGAFKKPEAVQKAPPAPTPIAPPPVAAPASTPCKFGVNCTRPNCHFSHPVTPSAQTACKFGLRCTRPDCAFKHPPGRAVPNHKTFYKGMGDVKASLASAGNPVKNQGGNRSVVFNTPASTKKAEQAAQEKKEEKEVAQIVKPAEGVTAA